MNTESVYKIDIYMKLIVFKELSWLQKILMILFAFMEMCNKNF